MQAFRRYRFSASAATLIFLGSLAYGIPSLASTPSIATIEAQAKAGQAKAEDELGTAYAEGSGVTHSYHKAFYWWRKAAMQGNIGGEMHLGIAYANGYGVQPNDALALHWEKRAAAQGNLIAKHNVQAIESDIRSRNSGNHCGEDCEEGAFATGFGG